VDVSTRGRCLYKETSEYLEEMVDEVDQDDIVRLLGDQDWQFQSTWFDDQLEHFLTSIIGSNREHSRRWRLLLIVFPSRSTMQHVNFMWKILGASAPNLVTLDLYNINENWIINGHKHPRFSALRDLVIQDSGSTEGFRISSLGIIPQKLEHLDFRTDWRLSNIEELSSFMQLRTLVINFLDNDSPSADLGDIWLPEINFPYLETLTLRHWYPHLHDVKFDLPSLQTLRLDFWDSHYKLPKVSPRHIYWRNEKAREQEVGTKKAKHSMCQLVLLSSVIESITIEEVDKKLLLEVVAQCKAERRIPALEKVIVQRRDKCDEVIDVPSMQ
jgi:hypothetical protein